MKKISFILILAIFFGCSTDSGTGGSFTTDISIPTPENWTCETNYPVAAGVSADFVLFAPNSYSNFRANAIVLTDNDVGNVTLEQAVQQEIEAMESNPMVSSYQVDSAFAKNFGSASGYVLETHFIQQGYPIKSREIFILRDGVGYQIIFTRHLNDMASQEAFTQMEAGISLL